MIVQVTDDYQVRCADKMNWQVYELCTVKKRGEDGSYSGKTEKQWIGLASYHRSVKGAVIWIGNRIAKSDKYNNVKTDLKGFVKEMDAIADRIERAADKYEVETIDDKVR